MYGATSFSHLPPVGMPELSRELHDQGTSDQHLSEVCGLPRRSRLDTKHRGNDIAPIFNIHANGPLTGPSVVVMPYATTTYGPGSVSPTPPVHTRFLPHVYNFSVWDRIHSQPYRICFCLRVTLSVSTSVVFYPKYSSSETVTILSALTRLEGVRLVFAYPISIPIRWLDLTDALLMGWSYYAIRSIWTISWPESMFHQNSA